MINIRKAEIGDYEKGTELSASRSLGETQVHQALMLNVLVCHQQGTWLFYPSSRQ